MYTQKNLQSILHINGKLEGCVFIGDNGVTLLIEERSASEFKHGYVSVSEEFAKGVEAVGADAVVFIEKNKQHPRIAIQEFRNGKFDGVRDPLVTKDEFGEKVYTFCVKF
jgi:hypothetical protein